MCYDPIINYEDPVGECPECGGPIDAYGDTTEVCCIYSPKICNTCGYSPCDGSC